MECRGSRSLMARPVVGVGRMISRRGLWPRVFSPATYFNWKKNYAGLLPTEMKRLKQLEDENSRLKKIVADLTLDREMLQDVIRRKL